MAAGLVFTLLLGLSFGLWDGADAAQMKDLGTGVLGPVCGGFLFPSTSSGSPLDGAMGLLSPERAGFFFVEKNDGSLRSCIDYPFKPVHGDTIFIKLDLRNVHHLLWVCQGAERKTTFKTPIGHFDYLVMPFGLCNAPAFFQALINDHHLENKLYDKAEKCECHKSSVTFLGYNLRADRPGSKNIKPDALSRLHSPAESVKESSPILPPTCSTATITWKIEDVINQALRSKPGPKTSPPNHTFLKVDIQLHQLSHCTEESLNLCCLFQKYCLQLDSHLASYHSTGEYNFIRENIFYASGKHTQTWVGAHDSAEEGVWMWSDGSKFIFSNWAASEPKNDGGVEHCMNINVGEAEHVNDEDCAKKLPFICAIHV
ncbi:uncharacterized protein LOC111608961 [Xiphophorus maculatus]|uniref:uncharacterized protein LOC111608961 n=1 Tax=Xiphophorus maculatus TaxID=8083 RepID=UPI000C6EA3B7|nr:uncharacterized protein LOC111608961 [Xiphophorus maculatus]